MFWTKMLCGMALVLTLRAGLLAQDGVNSKTAKSEDQAWFAARTAKITSPSARERLVAGYVHDRLTGRPIPGTTIRFDVRRTQFPGHYGELSMLSTDKRGRFAGVVDVGDPRYRAGHESMNLEIRAEGYVSGRVSVPPQMGGRGSSLDLTLTPIPRITIDLVDYDQSIPQSTSIGCLVRCGTRPLLLDTLLTDEAGRLTIAIPQSESLVDHTLHLWLEHRGASLNLSDVALDRRGRATRKLTLRLAEGFKAKFEGPAEKLNEKEVYYRNGFCTPSSAHGTVFRALVYPLGDQPGPCQVLRWDGSRRGFEATVQSGAYALHVVIDPGDPLYSSFSMRDYRDASREEDLFCVGHLRFEVAPIDPEPARRTKIVGTPIPRRALAPRVKLEPVSLFPVEKRSSFVMGIYDQITSDRSRFPPYIKVEKDHFVLVREGHDEESGGLMIYGQDWIAETPKLGEVAPVPTAVPTRRVDFSAMITPYANQATAHPIREGQISNQGISISSGSAEIGSHLAKEGAVFWLQWGRGLSRRSKVSENTIVRLVKGAKGEALVARAPKPLGPRVLRFEFPDGSPVAGWKFSLLTPVSWRISRHGGFPWIDATDPRTGMPHGMVVTDASGEIHVQGAMPGTWIAIVSSRPHDVYSYRFFTRRVFRRVLIEFREDSEVTTAIVPR